MMRAKAGPGKQNFRDHFSRSSLQKYGASHWLFMASPLVALLFTESLLRLSFVAVGAFLVSNPLDFLLGFLLAASAYGLFRAITPNKYVASALLFLASALLGAGGRIKLEYRQTGPMLSDLGLLGEAGAMWRVLSASMVIKSLIAAVLFGALLFAMAYKAKYDAITPRGRMVAAGVFALVWAMAFFFMPGRLYQNKNGEMLKQNATQTGAYVYFAATLKTAPPPLGQPSQSASLSPSGSQSGSNSQQSLPEENALANWFSQTQQMEWDEKNTPDIIVIQSESFYDPTQTLGLEVFSQDPLPYFHRLQQESHSFTVDTPAFGGDTVSAEFEVLTGLPVGVFPAGVNMFTDMVQKPTMALGWVLGAQGYETTAMHPYNTDYYRRDTVYRFFGFDRFLGLEALEEGDPNFHANAFTTGDTYANDLELTRQIINQLEAGENGKKLVFAISMQNHMPYAHQHPGYEIDYLGEGNKRAVKEFSNFASGLRKTDQSLENLIEYLRTREKETMVVFYGDHLPALELNRSGADLSDPAKSRQRYQVPALIWSNKRTLYTQKDQLDMSSIPELLLSAGGLDSPPHFQTLRNLRQEGLNAFTDYYAVIHGEVFYRDTPQYQQVYRQFESVKQEVWDFVPKPLE